MAFPSIMQRVRMPKRVGPCWYGYVIGPLKNGCLVDVEVHYRSRAGRPIVRRIAFRVGRLRPERD